MKGVKIMVTQQDIEQLLSKDGCDGVRVIEYFSDWAVEICVDGAWSCEFSNKYKMIRYTTRGAAFYAAMKKVMVIRNYEQLV